MQNDWESKFYKELSTIEDTKSKTDKLASNYKKLSKRIDQIEVQGIQEQLNCLHDSLLKTQRLLARFFILYTANHITACAQQQQPETSHIFVRQLEADTAAARTQVDKSKEPFVIANEFSTKSYDGAKKRGIKFIMV